jgi:DHA1 family tetracycline resistance protein-like MFS transporter
MLIGMFGVIVLMRLAHDANPVIWSYYTMLKFHWSPAQVGYSLMAVGAMMAVVFSVLTRVIVPRIGELRAAYLGMACGAIGFLGYAYATQSWMLYASMTVWVMFGLATPSLNAIMSKEVGSTEQGELQGALASLGGLTSVVAPPLLSNLFGYFTSSAAPVYFPGAAFLAAAVFMILAVLLLATAHRTQPVAA